ncbi:hypothetical protein BO71DRAFT_442740 [Aspergillus ellipticus CBS 707.79]|uniref:Nudix hydrolase domain-containing protein n=1 Tax=Aspergillus ellipticus CBS 707.79 TaxID=1448320 RepID=A0A319D3R9_9EURO|nr:hypothetical protein BO71DRAFT_442740 [Aspergillus ellipticus CBS 707.79]
MTTKSLYQVVADLDKYPLSLPEQVSILQNYHTLLVPGIPTPLGYVPSALITTHPEQWPPSLWTITPRSITLMTPPTAPAATRTATLASALRHMAVSSHPDFRSLKGWRDETFPVYGPGGDLVLEIERAASALFGVVTYGVQLQPSTSTPTPIQTPPTHPPTTTPEGINLWIATRSPHKQAYPNMLDTTAAGGLPTSLSPLSAIIAEATDEAGMPADLLQKIEFVDRISYFHINDNGNGMAVLQPEVEYCFELELPEEEGVAPRPGDGEVQGFGLWATERVVEELRAGGFKPNSAVVVVEFLRRWGVVAGGDVEGVWERLHRVLPLPVVDHGV